MATPDFPFGIDLSYARRTYVDPVQDLLLRTKEKQTGHWLEKAVDVSRFPMPIVIIVEHRAYIPATPGDLVLTLVAIVRDRENGEPTRVVSERTLHSFGAENDRNMLILQVYEGLKQLVLHELDECVLVDGVRVFDPHKADYPLRPPVMLPNPPNMAQQGNDEVRTGPPADLVRIDDAAALELYHRDVNGL